MRRQSDNRRQRDGLRRMLRPRAGFDESGTLISVCATQSGNSRRPTPALTLTYALGVTVVATECFNSTIQVAVPESGEKPASHLLALFISLSDSGKE